MKDLSIDILVNKEHPLDMDYEPKDMYVVDENENNFHQYVDHSVKPMLRKEVKPYIEALIRAALDDGLYLLVDSGYRSSAYQAKVLDKLIKEKGEEALLYVALPGSSEHQTGLAIDFAYFKNGEYVDDLKEEDKEAIWLKNKAWKYGFILRYPKNKEHITGFNFEPWHYRFVGLSLAKKLYEEGLTLEEYKNNISY